MRTSSICAEHENFSPSFISLFIRTKNFKSMGESDQFIRIGSRLLVIIVKVDFEDGTSIYILKRCLGMINFSTVFGFLFEDISRT